MNELQRNVIAQLGYNPDKPDDEELVEILKDIVNHGIGGGFHGFIYTVDTVEFFLKNQTGIIDLVEKMSDSLDEDAVGMVAVFNCLRPASKEDKAGIGRCLYCTHRSVEEIFSDKDTTIANALAWFAAEEVARELTEG